MPQTAQAAKSALANFCSASMTELAEACATDAKDANVGPVLQPLGLYALFRVVGAKLDADPRTATAHTLEQRLEPLLKTLARSGIQDSDRYTRAVDSQLHDLRDLLA
jgi:hypothetical protein